MIHSGVVGLSIYVIYSGYLVRSSFLIYSVLDNSFYPLDTFAGTDLFDDYATFD